MTIDDLPDPRALLAETDWSALDAMWAGPYHPLDPATATPDALAALVSGDRDAVTAALNHLSDDLRHQGSLYDATGPAARYVAALLADPGSRRALAPAWEAGRRPLRAKLLDWLAGVAHAVSDAGEEQAREFGHPDPASTPRFREIRALRPALFQGVSACLDDEHPTVHHAALAASIPLLDDPALRHHRTALAPQVRRELATCADQDHRFAAICGLRAWGADTTTLDAHAELAEHERRQEEWERGRRGQGISHDGRFDEPPF
ncbi:hypothetical protein DPM19_18805 [Actinomadura craniellae]|uniref:Uncharacterized protein n=1 Tax=Actinomadura craniellae TaxID=2231787 RepID=A0A365H650_9ACTN|nr:hypothetical protein [Actinomadura craniellae]RAY13713.1 hypothetical protein DPM19_18805 [Actinomadura craniellae]